MNIYRDIDELPLYNYSKIIDTNELGYLIVDSSPYNLKKLDKKELFELSEVWKNINCQIIDYIGISDDMRQVLRIEKDISLLRLQMIETGDRSIDTIINLKELELNQIRPKEKKSIEESIVLLEIFLKMPINSKNTSVKRYYGYIDYILKNGRKK